MSPVPEAPRPPRDQAWPAPGEGGNAVDLAYMERVATMLRTFSSQGHTLFVTTNLNNDFFLPELLAAYPKAQRMGRILNLIERGRPHKVQKARHAQFEKILHAVEIHPIAR